jgi:hypothetical protein
VDLAEKEAGCTIINNHDRIPPASHCASRSQAVQGSKEACWETQRCTTTIDSSDDGVSTCSINTPSSTCRRYPNKIGHNGPPERPTDHRRFGIDPAIVIVAFLAQLHAAESTLLSAATRPLAVSRHNLLDNSTPLLFLSCRRERSFCAFFGEVLTKFCSLLRKFDGRDMGSLRFVWRSFTPKDYYF